MKSEAHPKVGDEADFAKVDDMCVVGGITPSGELTINVQFLLFPGLKTCWVGMDAEQAERLGNALLKAAHRTRAEISKRN